MIYAKGSAINVKPNGGCFKEKNKIKDYTGLFLSAYEEVQEESKKSKTKRFQLASPYMEAMASCEAQESKSDWYKIATQLEPQLKKGAKSNSGGSR